MNQSIIKKEIERKFLLKNLPIFTDFGNPEIQQITQYYYCDDNANSYKRIRKIDSNLYGISYLHTIKTHNDGFVFEEERISDYNEYLEIVNNINSGIYSANVISKTRYVFDTGIAENYEGENRNVKWEIDEFNFNLIIAEIEIPYEDYELILPKEIKNNLIKEVTNDIYFSNKKMANKIVLNFQKS